MQGQILLILRKANGFVSGEILSGKLKISRAGIWKHIEDLRRQGYLIEALPRRGYRLVSAPDKLFAVEIQSGLTTKYFGKKIFCYDTIASTMDEAAQEAAAGCPQGGVVCADTQTRGRGRLGRNWVSPRSKGLYFSVILRPNLPLQEVAKITLLAAVAVCETLREVSGADVRIKWPNDLLVGSKKICGILTELSAETDRVKYVILGIGVNVNTTPPALPEIATSLKSETGKTFSRVKILQLIMLAMEKYYEGVKDQGFDAVFKRWRELSATLGCRVSVADGGQKLEGVAIDLAEDGGLLIRDDQGKTIKKMSGDVTVLKT